MPSECEAMKVEAKAARGRGLKCVKIWKVSPGEGLLFLSGRWRAVTRVVVMVRRLPGRIARGVGLVMLGLVGDGSE